MGTRRYDTVKPNREAFKKDLARMGITMQQVSKSMGKTANYAAALFASDAAERTTVEAVEDRMFAEHGTYYTEIVNEKEAPKPVVTEGTGILLKQIVGRMDQLAQRMDTMILHTDNERESLVKAIRETQAANELLLKELVQKEKEICTLNARLLSFWERGNK